MSAKKKQQKKTPEELLQEALVPEEEQPYKIPDNWVYFYFTSVIDIKGGTQPPKSEFIKEPKEGYVRLIQIRDFSTNDFKVYIPKKDNLNYIDEKDILIARYGASVGKVFRGLKGACNVALAKTIFPEQLLNRNYIFWLLKSDLFQKPLKQISRSAQAGFNKSDLSYFKIPLPPLPEQKRIVTRVESLLEKINEARELIAEARETFEQRRAAILAKAFWGELTAKWREQNPDVEPAEKLLERIKKEKAILEQGKKGKRKKQEELPPIDPPYELPEGWCWVRLGDIIESTTYGLSAKTNDDPEGIPVLRMGNIQNGKIVLNDLKYLPKSHKDIKNLSLEPGDLLFNRTNSYELVGKTAIVANEHKKMTFASYLIRIRLIKKQLLSKYICFYINSNLGRQYLLSQVTQQVGQANINATKLSLLPIPLPPEREISVITKIVRNYLSYENEVSNYLQLEVLDLLRDSILSKAFRGELGTNDPSEESALELLKEIVAQRAK